MTSGQRIRQLMKEERERTMQISTILNCPDEQANDLTRLFLAFQSAMNQYINEVDRTLHGNVATTALRMSAEEVERIGYRLRHEGLAQDPD